MYKAGYGERSKLKNTIKAVYDEALRIAEKEHEVKRTPKGWHKTFARIMAEHNENIRKISHSGRNGGDAVLFKKFELYSEMNEVEHDKAQHVPPGLVNSSDQMEEDRIKAFEDTPSSS